MKKVILREIHNDEGLQVIEAVDENGSHFADFLWDDRDEQTPENREKFRDWVHTMLKRMEAHI